MPPGKIFKPIKLNIYAVSLTIILFVITLSPLLFYWSGHMKNPREFMVPEKRHLAVELEAYDMSPECLSAIEVGDSERDCNGDEVVKILSILKTEPRILGKLAVEGNGYADILSANSNVSLLLKVRYNDIMGRLIPYTTTDVELKVGNFFSFKTSKHITLNGKIVKVDTYK